MKERYIYGRNTGNSLAGNLVVYKVADLFGRITLEANLTSDSPPADTPLVQRPRNY